MVLLMGIAGSGKGTQGQLLASVSGYHVISTGELLRNYGSQDQHERMHRGEMIADEEITALVDTALSDLDNPSRTILDGYPRTKVQAEWLLGECKRGRFEIDYVLHLIASQEAVKERLHVRARPDDHDEAIEARFMEYDKATLPIIKYYKEQGLAVVEVDGEQTIEEVHKDVMIADTQHRQGEQSVHSS